MKKVASTMEQQQYKRRDKTMHVAEYFYTVKVVEPLLPALSKTFLTPNMVTIFNSFLAMLIFYLSYLQKYTIVALLIQLYLFLDILDGNLARYKNMKSDFGAKLDSINDRVFYTLVFVFIGAKSVPVYLILGVIFLNNLYGIIATYYIVPRLRKLDAIERRGLKKYFMDRGLIIGMDLGTIDILTTIFLLINVIKPLYIVLILGLLSDIAFRLVELKYNERLKRNQIL